MRRFAPAAERNRAPILAELTRLLTEPQTVLEVAAGTGQHAAAFSRGLPHVTWIPTDLSDDALRSIDAYREEAALPNLQPALRLDVCSETWPVETADTIFNVNMVHIAPWSATEGLFRGAARISCSRIITYGPYFIPGRPTAPSNQAFDRSLRSQNPEWGLRDLADVDSLASEHGFERAEVVDMPANNVVVVFARKVRQ